MDNSSQQQFNVEDHDLGLAHDLERLKVLNRRRALGFFGTAGGAVFIAACGGESSTLPVSTTPTLTPTPSSTSTPTPTPTSTSSASCTAYAQETNGPYPADGTNQSRGSTSNVLPIAAFQRSDVRASVIGSSSVAPGVAMPMTLTLVDVNNSCTPLAGYAVYIWHCDATGLYSLYDLPSESYLRGIQVTDANGQVSFTSIVPGCYAGRYPHIHFEAFSSLANATTGRYARLISQLALPADVCATVYSDTATYGSSLTRFRNTSIASDGIFGDNTADQKTAMTLAMTGSMSAGYTASATVGLTT
ncbi:intradiol ring-cleavage dioxygenase [Erythrobacter sp. 3-20A1M]|uniref:dioxygenase family protein n=1 Tax=Erythrobacter sp. 3-20A1M TaxID=2653850 RepID=UPI001BFC2F76|nr:intradiol ring-cleavage dioxygenase [Erythrobacter sp. 3-20A1M]QWC56505.1 intradiol ring-cleavage dioxygenase [Erythrobacter sp. 3-20A1M]